MKVDCAYATQHMVAFVKGELSETDVKAMRAHLDACESCQAEARAVRHTLGLADRASRVAPSKATWNKLQNETRAMGQLPAQKQLPAWVWVILLGLLIGAVIFALRQT